jgi:hypothetical protein
MYVNIFKSHLMIFMTVLFTDLQVKRREPRGKDNNFIIVIIIGSAALCGTWPSSSDFAANIFLGLFAILQDQCGLLSHFSRSVNRPQF